MRKVKLKYLCTVPPFISTVLVTHGQLKSENIKWKIPEINNSQVLSGVLWMCIPFNHVKAKMRHRAEVRITE